MNSPRTQATGSGWKIVASVELRSLWSAGLGSWAVLALALLLSFGTVAIDRTFSVHLLDARSGALAMVRLATGVGVLLAMLAAADSISGERERETLERLLLTPIPQRDLVVGKGLAALSLWAACFLVSVPYLAVMGTFSGVGAATVAVSGIVGFLAAVLLTSAGMWLSLRASSNRGSLAAGLLAVAVLGFPGFLPASTLATGPGSLLVRLDPVAALVRFLNLVVADGQPLAQEVGWLVSPIVAAALMLGATLAASKTIALDPGR